MNLALQYKEKRKEDDRFSLSSAHLSSFAISLLLPTIDYSSHSSARGKPVFYFIQSYFTYYYPPYLTHLAAR